MTSLVDSGCGSRLALFLPSLAGGGVARVYLQLAAGFVDRGHAVDLVLCQDGGPYRKQVAETVRVLTLPRENMWRSRLRAVQQTPGDIQPLILPIVLSRRPPPVLPYLAGLADYLRIHRPLALLSGKTHTNLVAIWARRLAGVDTRVVISERTNLSNESGTSPRWRWRFVRPLVERVYPLADEITSVSDGVSEDLSIFAGLPRERVLTIYNPVVRPGLNEKARQRPDHPWFASGSPPLVLAVGRLTEQKQFPILLDAFDRVRRSRDVRLLILGEGKERQALQAKIGALGLGDQVDMPGFADNPYAYMSQAALFVLSSAWEGLPGALIEAIACGCPVVSTDCPDGPREILEQGRYGPLVPVGDPQALAAAMESVLDSPPDREGLRRRGRDFAAAAAIDRYLEVLTGH